MQSGTPDAACAIMERAKGQWISHLLHVPYDASAMVALARQHGKTVYFAFEEIPRAD